MEHGSSKFDFTGIHLDFIKQIFNQSLDQQPEDLPKNPTLWDYRLSGFGGTRCGIEGLYAQWEGWVVSRIYEVYGIVVTDLKTPMETIYMAIL